MFWIRHPDISLIPFFDCCNLESRERLVELSELKSKLFNIDVGVSINSRRETLEEIEEIMRDSKEISRGRKW